MDVLYFDLGDELRFPENQLTAGKKAKKNIYCSGSQVWLQKNVKKKKNLRRQFPRSHSRSIELDFFRACIWSRHFDSAA